MPWAEEVTMAVSCLRPDSRQRLVISDGDSELDSVTPGGHTHSNMGNCGRGRETQDQCDWRQRGWMLRTREQFRWIILMDLDEETICLFCSILYFLVCGCSYVLVHSGYSKVLDTFWTFVRTRLTVITISLAREGSGLWRSAPGGIKCLNDGGWPVLTNTSGFWTPVISNVSALTLAPALLINTDPDCHHSQPCHERQQYQH